MAYRRRTSAPPLKEDCQVVNRQWFAAVTANLRSQGGGGKGRGAGPWATHPPPPPPPLGAQLWRRRRWRRRQRRRRRSLSDPDLGFNGGGCLGGDPLWGELCWGDKCLGTTRNHAVPVRADWGCSLVQRGAQRVPARSPRGSLAPPAGLAVAGPVIRRRAPSFGGGTRRTTRKR